MSWIHHKLFHFLIQVKCQQVNIHFEYYCWLILNFSNAEIFLSLGKYLDQSKVDKYILLNIESKCPCFWYILTLHHLIFFTEFVTFDCQKRLLWSLEKQYLIKLFFKNGVIYGDQEPLSNKNRFFHWIFALPTGWKVSKYGFTQCSALAMSVGNKNVFDGELKLLFVTSFVESL